MGHELYQQVAAVCTLNVVTLLWGGQAGAAPQHVPWLVSADATHLAVVHCVVHEALRHLVRVGKLLSVASVVLRASAKVQALFER